MSTVKFSYSTTEQPLAQRLVIQLIEKLSGQRRLKRLYERYRSCGSHEDFLSAAIRLLELDVQYDRAALDHVPKTGPVLFVANHPYGVLDGIMLSWLATRARNDVKVLAHAILCQAPETRGLLLPINFGETAEARRITLGSRIEAQAWLKAGHALGIFPAGGVSFSHSPLRGTAVDLAWAPFTVKLARMARAAIIPVYFAGQNSRLFQIASHVSMTLRTSLLFHETARHIGRSLEVRIGRPIAFDDLPSRASRDEVVNLLRRQTYSLAHPSGERSELPDYFMQPTVLTIYERSRRTGTSRSVGRAQSAEASARGSL
jgi:putative hemolysin